MLVMQYITRRKLLNAIYEKEAIPYIVLANQFIATAYFSDNDKYTEIYEVNVKMTEWIIDNFDKLEI